MPSWYSAFGARGYEKYFGIRLGGLEGGNVEAVGGDVDDVGGDVGERLGICEGVKVGVHVGGDVDSDVGEQLGICDGENVGLVGEDVGNTLGSLVFLIFVGINEDENEGGAVRDRVGKKHSP